MVSLLLFGIKRGGILTYFSKFILTPNLREEGLHQAWIEGAV